MPRILHDYVDGAVDLKTGVAMSADGVQKFRFPHLSYVAEKTGSFITLAVSSARAMRPVIYRDEAGYAKASEGFRVSPQTHRRVGAIALAIGLPAASMLTAEPVLDAGNAVVVNIGEVVDQTIVEPWANLGRSLSNLGY